MKGIKTKLMAGVITVWGLSLVTTNAQPKLWQVAFISIGLYEAAILIIKTYQSVRNERTIKRIHQINNQINKRNAKNLNEFRIGWPMREVDV